MTEIFDFSKSMVNQSLSDNCLTVKFLEFPLLRPSNIKPQGLSIRDRLTKVNSLVVSTPKSNCSQVIISKPYIPVEASKKELRIHGFLSDQKIFSINVKEMLSDLNKDFTPSQKLQLALKNRSSSRKGSPLLDRRKNSPQLSPAIFCKEKLISGLGICKSSSTNGNNLTVSSFSKQSTLLEDNSQSDEAEEDQFRDTSFASTIAKINKSSERNKYYQNSNNEYSNIQSLQ